MADPSSAPAPEQLVELFARLRRECAWKAAQTHRSLARYLLEETYEALEAIDSGDPDRLRDELGDVLLQVHLHAAIAAEEGSFDFADVAAGLRDKMIRRNPHVFGDAVETDPVRIDAAWQRIKAAERGAAGPPALDVGIPQELPALLRATKVLERLAQAGDTVLPGAGEPAEGGDPARSIGSRLLALVEEARVAQVDPEQALRETLRDLTNRTY
ncbi:MAG: MazG nucleotide pyrophosphohydrolase domain-containing protein [Marmoricola sp.]